MIKLNDDELLQSKIDFPVIEYDIENTFAISKNCHDFSVSLKGKVK